MDEDMKPAAPAGWYDNPKNPAELRWWNGTEWTDHIQSKSAAPSVSIMPPPKEGSRPASSEAAGPSSPRARGWHEDPKNPKRLRWWDGSKWGYDTKPKQRPKPASTTDSDWAKIKGVQPPVRNPDRTNVSTGPLRKVSIGLLILMAVYWGFQGLSGFWDGNGSSNQNTTSAISVQSARSEVQILLLGKNWTGSGSYTLLDSAKAYNSTGQWWVIAARVSAPGGQLQLFWSADGTNIGDGLIIGDTVTREFSVWGAASSASSPAADLVRSRQNSSYGQAVIEAVGG